MRERKTEGESEDLFAPVRILQWCRLLTSKLRHNGKVWWPSDDRGAYPGTQPSVQPMTTAGDGEYERPVRKRGIAMGTLTSYSHVSWKRTHWPELLLAQPDLRGPTVNTIMSGSMRAVHTHSHTRACMTRQEHYFMRRAAAAENTAVPAMQAELIQAVGAISSSVNLSNADHVFCRFQQSGIFQQHSLWCYSNVVSAPRVLTFWTTTRWPIYIII